MEYMEKECFKCHKVFNLRMFYRHPRMADSHLNKCKDCTKIDNKTSNGKEKRNCWTCKKEFFTRITEIKKGRGVCCSRKCHYEKYRQTSKEETHYTWKGDNVGLSGLHDWVRKHLGRPKKCEHCGIENAKQYDWANKSREYKRDLNDWIRLCRKCHLIYDNVAEKRKITMKLKH